MWVFWCVAKYLKETNKILQSWEDFTWNHKGDFRPDEQNMLTHFDLIIIKRYRTERRAPLNKPDTSCVLTGFKMNLPLISAAHAWQLPVTSVELRPQPGFEIRNTCFWDAFFTFEKYTDLKVVMRSLNKKSQKPFCFAWFAFDDIGFKYIWKLGISGFPNNVSLSDQRG